MTPSDQFTAASKQQLATQLALFQALTTRAFDNAERILALNIQTTRATLDQTSGVVRQLAAARDPRDLLALGAQSQQHIETALAYSRKLFEIASKPAAPLPAHVPETASAAAPAVAPAAAPELAPTPAEEQIVAAPPVVVDEPVAEAAPQPVAAVLEEPEPAPVVSAIEPSAHPLGESDPAPVPAMPAKAKAIAKAASELAAAPIDMPHPAASPMPADGPVDIPAIAPADASPQPKRGKGAKKR